MATTARQLGPGGAFALHAAENEVVRLRQLLDDAVTAMRASSDRHVNLTANRIARAATHSNHRAGEG